ncbi:MAG: HAMP domain-containing histidine kinase, partial [Alphaproteobacteria bacterium]|nr:HAMP domain-containing histidine kinase [Alphaproteobacteria bacterium]
MSPASVRPRSLSARLLVLTALFVMLAEVLIYVPSISNFRLTWLKERLSAAHLAVLALDATPDAMVDDALRRELLAHAEVHAVAIVRAGRRELMLAADRAPTPHATVDLADTSPPRLMTDALMTLVAGDDRVIRLIGPSPRDASARVEAVFDETPLRRAMVVFSERILALSIVISLITAALVYVSLHVLIVRPIGRLTESMIAFRDSPEDQSRTLEPAGRSDEIGVAEAEFARLQAELREALGQKTRLADVGTAVAKIGHDLGNTLATANLVADRLAESADPEVRRMAPRMIAAIDRAVSLCEATLRYGQAGDLRLQLGRFPLRPLIEEVRAALAPPGGDNLAWRIDIPETLVVRADRDQLFRVLFNLCRNAIEAQAGRDGMIRVGAGTSPFGIVLEIEDQGPGLPEMARQHLYRP